MDVLKLKLKADQLSADAEKAKQQLEKERLKEQKLDDTVKRKIREYYDTLSKKRSQIINGINNISDDDLQDYVENKLTLDDKIILEFALYLPLIKYKINLNLDMTAIRVDFNNFLDHGYGMSFDDYVASSVNRDLKRFLQSMSVSLTITDASIDFCKNAGNCLFNITDFENDGYTSFSFDSDDCNIVTKTKHGLIKNYPEDILTDLQFHESSDNNRTHYNYYTIFNDIETFKEDCLDALTERLQKFGCKIIKADSDIDTTKRYGTKISYRVEIKNPTID